MPDPKIPFLDLPPSTQEDAYGAQLLADLCRADRGEGMAKLLPVVTAARLWAEEQMKPKADDTLRRGGEGQDEKFGY